MRSGKGFVALVMFVSLLEAPADGERCRSTDQDQVHRTDLAEIRLGDGVPLKLSLAIRWRIEDGNAFSRQFSDPPKYASLILDPKSREAASHVGEHVWVRCLRVPAASARSLRRRSKKPFDKSWPSRAS